VIYATEKMHKYNNYLVSSLAHDRGAVEIAELVGDIWKTQSVQECLQHL